MPELRIGRFYIEGQLREMRYTPSKLELFAEELTRKNKFTLTSAWYAEDNQFGPVFYRTRFKSGNDMHGVTYIRAPADIMLQEPDKKVPQRELVEVSLIGLDVKLDSSGDKISIKVVNTEMADAYRRRLSKRVSSEQARAKYTGTVVFGPDEIEQAIDFLNNFILNSV